MGNKRLSLATAVAAVRCAQGLKPRPMIVGGGLIDHTPAIHNYNRGENPNVIVMDDFAYARNEIHVMCAKSPGKSKLPNEQFILFDPDAHKRLTSIARRVAKISKVKEIATLKKLKIEKLSKHNNRKYW